MVSPMTALYYPDIMEMNDSPEPNSPPVVLQVLPSLVTGGVERGARIDRRERFDVARKQHRRAVALEQRELVAYDPARTPGEYRRLVRGRRSEAAPAFDELAERFTRAAFAREPALRDDFEAAQRAYAVFEPATRA